MPKKSIKELFSLEGKVAVITGAAMGIGYAIAERFAEAGARVVISDIDVKAGEKKAKELNKKYSQALFIKADVSSEKDVQALIKKTTGKFGVIDVFVNNAGIFPSAKVLDMDLKLWEKIQAVNLRGVFLCSREATRVMKVKGSGNIINVASIDALHPSQAGLSSYDASKHGVWGFTKNFALEAVQYGIRVNAIAPGGIQTEGVERMTGGAIKAGSGQKNIAKEFTAKIPMGRFGQPDEMAMVALFLACDASSYMTGSMIVADGGYLLS